MTRKPSLADLFEPGAPGRPPELQVRLYDALKSGKDTAIADLFSVAYPDADMAEQRLAQQRLGPPITKLNRRLRSYAYAIRPGRARGTYALVSL